MGIQVDGLKELRQALRDTEGASVREISTQLRSGAEKVTAAARGNIHSKSGRLAADARPFATAKAAGVRFTLDYAGVQEFAGTWLRRNPRSKRGKLGRGEKGAHFQRGATIGGTNEVHYTSPTPRFAFKAINDLGPALIDETWDALVDVLKAHGWWTG